MINRSQIIPPYSQSAEFYDELMADIDYEGWAEYLMNVAREFQINTDRIVDFSCGTGTLLNCLSKSAEKVRGVDLSEAMIRQAKQKYPQHEWLVGDMMSTHFPPGFSLGINVHDSLNYIPDTYQLTHYLNRMQKECRPGQNLMFDFALPALLHRYFVDQDESKKLKNGAILYRRHEYLDDEKSCLTYLEITRNKQRVIEIHRQQIWTFNEIKEMFVSLPRQKLLFLEEFSFQEASEDSERLLTVIQND
jgi:SAM-dependent methyltransferase